MKLSPNLPRIIILISNLTLRDKPSRLATKLSEILPRYADQARIEIVETTIANLLPVAQKLEREDDVDIIICSGASAEFLRKNISTTVLSIRMGEYDLIKALNLAKDLGAKVGILSHQRTHAELKELASLLTIEISEVVYTSLEDARQKVRALIANGYRVIIGSPTAVELAEEFGVVGVSAINADAVRRALDDAIAICRSRASETKKHQRINAVLQHLSEGVMALDVSGRVQSINDSLSRLLNISERNVIGQKAQILLPDVAINRVLKSGKGEENQLIQVNRRKLIASVMPVFEDGDISGAVIACQEINTIQRADRRIRSQTRPSHFIARYTFDQLLGDAANFKQALHLARLYAATDSTILITGDSGTGKELIAQSIHNESNRSRAPFVAINCAAFPETLLESELFGYEEGAFTGARKGGKNGLFEAAHTGTVFLDEIGDMPTPLQTRLLRVLQEREILRLGASDPTPINIRVIAATHQNLQSRIEQGLFREDLYFRLNILRIAVPALKDRVEDIPTIASAMLTRLAKNSPDKRVRAGAAIDNLMPALTAHPWRGNIRELENIVERIYLSTSWLDGTSKNTHFISTLLPELTAQPTLTSHTTSHDASSLGLHALGMAAEVAHIQKILDSCDGDMSKTAKTLGISRSTLWRRLRKASDTPL